MAIGPQNDFLVWAGGTNANVLTQGQYAALGNSGVVSGKASAQQANKAWRQASIMASMLAKFIVDRINQPVVDDGSIQTIETNFIAAIQTLFGLGPTGVVPGTYGPTMTLSVELDGRVTGIANGGLTGTGITPGTYVGTTVTVGNDGRITGITGVAYGPLANANTWAQTQTGQQGFIATGFDAGGFDFRATNGNFGSGFRNDGTESYLLSTPSGSPFGSFGSFRPFQWNMTTGHIAIDGTGAGGITVGGTLSALGRLRAALGAFGSGDINSAVTLNDYILTGNINAWTARRPDGLMVQGGLVTLTGNNVPVGVALAAAFTTRILGVSVSYGVHATLGVPQGAVGATANGASLSTIVICSNTTPIGSFGVHYVVWGI